MKKMSLILSLNVTRILASESEYKNGAVVIFFIVRGGGHIDMWQPLYE